MPSRHSLDSLTLSSHMPVSFPGHMGGPSRSSLGTEGRRRCPLDVPSSQVTDLTWPARATREAHTSSQEARAGIWGGEMDITANRHLSRLSHPLSPTRPKEGGDVRSHQPSLVQALTLLVLDDVHSEHGLRMARWARRLTPEFKLRWLKPHPTFHQELCMALRGVDACSVPFVVRRGTETDPFVQQTRECLRRAHGHGVAIAVSLSRDGANPMGWQSVLVGPNPRHPELGSSGATLIRLAEHFSENMKPHASAVAGRT